ncbi:MAG TPA: hypothetical protein VLT59_13255 [Steroidobacteraceae bacterium]|nr:hypothetical protein [Steroidobacteraceae bacterium]
METALAITAGTYEPTARRRSVWTQKVASMSVRLESRWARSSDATRDAAADEQLCESAAARVAFDTVLHDLADAR